MIGHYRKIKTKNILAITFLVAGFAVFISGISRAQDSLRPGEFEKPSDIRPAGPLPYPDLSDCAALKDASLYRGEDRVMKFIHVGTGGWLYRSLDFRMDFTMPEKTMNYMKRVNEALAAKGIDLYVVLQPSRAMVVPQHIDPKDAPEGYNYKTAKENYKKLISQLQYNGIKTTDLSDPPEDFEYFFRGDPHWRREGSMWSAERIARIILKNPYFDGRAPEKFSNEITWWLESEKGEFDEFVDKFCNVNIPPERRPMWATTALTEGISETDLFGEVSYPDIAIVGTSNTAHEEDFNFVGSLKQQLSADIRNKAIAAGGFAGSSVVFYASDEFHKYPPKILIWEFLSHHVFDDYTGFRQMLPAIEGACTDEQALVSSVQQFPIMPGMPVANTPSQIVAQTIPVVYGPELPNAKRKRVLEEMHELMIFDNLDAKQVSAGDHYLYLEVTNPENRLLKIGILYANGDAEEIDVSRSRRAENNGKYYLEFNPEFQAPVMLVQIETEKPQGDVKARICKYNNAKP